MRDQTPDLIAIFQPYPWLPAISDSRGSTCNDDTPSGKGGSLGHVLDDSMISFSLLFSLPLSRGSFLFIFPTRVDLARLLE
jgi:hypothetical protein